MSTLALPDVQRLPPGPDKKGMSPWQKWGLILLTPYVEGSLGRWFPVTKSGITSAFWQADPHRKAVYNQFGAGTVTFEFTKNYKFTVLNNENVWAKAMSRIVNDNISVEKATDEMIARIKQVAG